VSAFSIGLTSFREQEAVATILFPAYLVVKIHEANVAFLLQIFKIKKNILGLETWERCATLICLSKPKKFQSACKKIQQKPFCSFVLD
jgi:hypothetical protein